MFLCSQALEDNRFNLLLETIQEVINEDTVVQKGTLNMRTQKVFLVKVFLLTMLCQYATSVKQPSFGNLSKFVPVVHMEISNPHSDLTPKL